VTGPISAERSSGLGVNGPLVACEVSAQIGAALNLLAAMAFLIFTGGRWPIAPRLFDQRITASRRTC
jgi:hypothetical protein